MNASAMFALVGPGALILGFLLPVAIVALVAYGAFELLRARTVDGAAVAGGPSAAPVGPSSTALGILDERFARGEIDAEDYVQRRSLLSPAAPTAAGPFEPSAGPTDPPAPTPVDEVSPVGEPTSEQPVAAAAVDGELPEGEQA